MDNVGRILAIDYGEKRIGLALSDEGKKIAFEFEIWQNADFFKKISALVFEKGIEKIVLGYPLNLSGEHTKKTEEVMQFKKELQSALQNIPVELIDERFSSKMAAKISGGEKNIDALSAQIFLQNYLNKNNSENEQARAEADTDV
jgi:putative Holliday junction resolvase